MKPDEIIEEVTKSGLRGRGGAGFPDRRQVGLLPQGRGRAEVRHLQRRRGRPGAYANRGLMEGNPHSIIEGMIIGAYAIGAAAKAIVYVRTEYPLAVILMQRPSTKPADWACWAKESSARTSASTSRSIAAAGRSSAANPRP